MAADDDEAATGCAILVMGAIALTIVVWSLSGVGHWLGLTPTFDEAFHRPDGWVGGHYENVVGGYLLTLVLVVWLLIVLVSTAVWSRRRRGGMHLTRGWIGLAAVLAAAFLLPIGSTVPESQQVAGDEGGPVAPNYVGKTMIDAQVEAEHIKITFPERPRRFAQDRCRITEQTPAPGAPLPPSGLQLKCKITIPKSIAGDLVSIAKSELELRGLTAKVINKPARGTANCIVRSWSPARNASPREVVKLRLQCRKPPRRQSRIRRAKSSRTSSSGSPAYAGQTCPQIGHSFSVTPGSDPAHDRDNDGSACESE